MKYTDYTEKMYDQLWSWDEDDDATVEKVRAFLNNTENFNMFGENLRRFIEKKVSPETRETPGTFLLARCKEKGVELNRNTVSKWLSEDLRPKKSEESREKLFKIAFALELTVEEPQELFHKVYLDRGLNLRRKREFIYQYCIKMGRSYQDAQRLLDRLDQEPGPFSADEDQTIGTCDIGKEIKNLTGDDAVLQYIREHPHNFEINNRTESVCTGGKGPIGTGRIDL